MKLERSKEWWLACARAEGDMPIAAGKPQRPLPTDEEVVRITPGVHKVRADVEPDTIRLVCEVHAVMCPRRHGVMDDRTTCYWDVGSPKDVAKWLHVTDELCSMNAEWGKENEDVRAFLDSIYPL